MCGLPLNRQWKISRIKDFHNIYSYHLHRQWGPPPHQHSDAAVGWRWRVCDVHGTPEDDSGSSYLTKSCQDPQLSVTWRHADVKTYYSQLQNRTTCLTRNTPTAQWSICFTTSRLSNSFPRLQLLWQKAASAKVGKKQGKKKSVKIHLGHLSLVRGKKSHTLNKLRNGLSSWQVFQHVVVRLLMCMNCTDKSVGFQDPGSGKHKLKKVFNDIINFIWVWWV